MKAGFLMTRNRGNIDTQALRATVETFYDLQKLRIQSGNRLNAYYSPLLEGLYTSIHNREKDTEKEFAKLVNEIPIWNSWLKDVKGLGPVFTIGLVAYIGDIGNFPTISSLWAYAGMHTDHYILKCKKCGGKYQAANPDAICGKFLERKKGELKTCDGTGEIVDYIKGKAPRRMAGVRSKHNPKLKTHCYKIATSLLKQRRKDKNGHIVIGGYRNLYDQFKSQYEDREDIKEMHRDKKGKLKPGYKGHVHSLAIRKMIKLFLSHLWVEWRTVEGLEISKPYAMEKLKHEHYIEPIRDTVTV